MSSEEKTSKYYTKGDILSSIVRCVQSTGKDISDLKPEDLSPVDAFHVRGRESTIELATLAQFSTAMRVLDIGCGLGGSVRHIAENYGCQATGLDLTHEYIEVARRLSDMVGLGSKVKFIQGSALNLPFDDESFDVAWTEHAQMNIEDKRQFYSQISRVLVAGGRLVFHDIFQGSGGPPHYPLPWAEESSCSALVTPDKAEAIIGESQFTIQHWTDKSDDTLRWFTKTTGKSRNSNALGIHLLLGATAGQKLKNMIRNLEERRISIVQGVAIKHF